jgi:formate dehydrogenase major subunit
LGSLENPNPKSKHSFIMRKHGHGQIFGPGRADGPLPEHYEPIECPVEKNFMSSVYTNPTAVVYGTKADIYKTCDPRYPFVGTTYRVTEHWQTGVMSRHQPWLLEMQPQVFVEMSEELAKLKQIKNGERVLATSPRGQLECSAIVTQRFKPLKIAGRLGTVVHQVGFPWCFGWQKPASGKEESANLLTPSTGDPNTRIPETKAFMVNIQKL